MGSSNQLFGESPPHKVSIERPFYLSQTPVTQAQWKSVNERNPSCFLGDEHPVDSVSWCDAVDFCNFVSQKSAYVVRLPTEAEWEYACRAGSTGDYFFTREGPFADEAAVHSAVRKILLDYSWFDENSGGSTHPVGLKKPNPLGLHDMIGNVWEWCADYWHSDYAGAPAGSLAWLDPPNRKGLRCLRGGAWDMNAFRCRSSYRSWDLESLATNRYGFRVAMETQEH